MTTVLAHGVFDVLHPGHLEHLRQARAMGDYLVVSVTDDPHVTKGPGRPIFTARERAGMLEALKVVDETVINGEASAIRAIEAYKPDIYVKGPDYGRGEDGAGNLVAERAAVESHGGTLLFTTGETLSSGAIINAAFPRLPESTMAWLRDFRTRHSAASVIEWLDKTTHLNAVVLGEHIIDEYQYVDAASRSPKEPVITFIADGVDEFDGGALIICDHLQGMGVDAYTYPAGIPVRKLRYVTLPFLAKVGSIAWTDGVEPFLKGAEGKPSVGANIVVCADFGHGYFGAEDIKVISRTSRFLVVMAQSNSLNWGFNLMTRWPRADYLIGDEPEFRLAAQDMDGPIGDIVRMRHRLMGARMTVATLGHHGCIVFDGAKIAEAPSLADKIVDRMGAGDAFLAATAPLVCAGAPAEVVALVGNIAGAIHVGVVGNSKALDAKEVRQWVTALLK